MPTVAQKIYLPRTGSLGWVTDCRWTEADRLAEAIETHRRFLAAITQAGAACSALRRASGIGG
jgi:hypothetical protein